jgi:hypothetical protein
MWIFIESLADIGRREENFGQDTMVSVKIQIDYQIDTEDRFENNQVVKDTLEDLILDSSCLRRVEVLMDKYRHQNLDQT